MPKTHHVNLAYQQEFVAIPIIPITNAAMTGYRSNRYIVIDFANRIEECPL